MEYFLKKVIAFFPFKIELPQTDNGTEWTNAPVSNDPTPTLFEQALAEAGATYKRIRVATPRHNGKVEWQYRIYQKRSYGKLRMHSLEDGRKQFRWYDCFFNAIPKVCLDYRSPNEALAEYQHKST
jgi:transposase InsO family protein